MVSGFADGAPIPFQAWLPAAMVAPNPVTSLVMVKGEIRFK